MADLHCLEVADLAEALAAPPDDPRRRHIEQCPRCGALARQYRDFMGESRPNARLEPAEVARLDQAMARARQRTAIVRKPSAAGRTRWWVAVPAVAAVLAIMILVPARRTPGPDPTVMRGRVEPDTVLTVNPARINEQGNIVLGWLATAAADSFVVEILAADLTVLATVSAGPGTDLELPPDSASAPRTRQFWRIIGFKEQDPVVRSGLREFPRMPRGDQQDK